MTSLMVEIRKQMGNGPVYVTLDIDALDPCYAPGTGIIKKNLNIFFFNSMYMILLFFHKRPILTSDGLTL